MSDMFSFCTNLVKVDLSSFNTKNVTNLESMFYECTCLIKIKRKNCIKNKFPKSKLFIIKI